MWVISIKVEAMKADKLTKEITTLKKEEKENARSLPIMNCEEHIKLSEKQKQQKNQKARGKESFKKQRYEGRKKVSDLSKQ